MALRVSKQQIDQAGINFVAAELSRRGFFASILANNLFKNIDIIATNANQTRTVMITVNTRRRGVWYASANDGKPSKKIPDETNFWIFVSIGKLTELPNYYIVPEWWGRNDIYNETKGFLLHKAKSNTYMHHGINVNRIEQWKDRWDILGLTTSRQLLREEACEEVSGSICKD